MYALKQTYECLIAVVCVYTLDRVCFRTHFTVLVHPAAFCLLSRWTHYYDFSTAVRRCLLYFCVKKTIEHKQKWYICALFVSGQACADQRKGLMENCRMTKMTKILRCSRCQVRQAQLYRVGF